MIGLEITPSDLRYGPAEFLTAADVPENLLRLKPGMQLQWHTHRRVIRVGYRKTYLDFMNEAEDRLNRPDVRAAQADLTAKLGLRHRLDLQREVARDLASQAGLGGPERGIWVRPRLEGDWVIKRHDLAPITVKSTYCARLGTYYGPCGSGEDYEDGGLSHPRTVVLVVSTDLDTFISGDLRRIP